MSVIARLSGAFVLGLFTLAPRAVAAQGFTLSRFDPAFAGDRMLGVPSPFVAGRTTLHAALLAEYAHRELGVRLEDAAGDQSYVGAVVAHRLLLHANVTLALWDRLAVNLEVPAALLQKGDDPAALGTTYVSPTTAQMGDLRLGARVRLLGGYHDPLQIGLGASLWLPTAPSTSFMGDGKVHGYPHLALGGEVARRVVWSLAAGPDLRASSDYAGVSQGTQVRFGAGAGVLVGPRRHVQLGAELYGNGNLGASAQTPNAEVLAHARWRVIDDLELGIAAGPGLSRSVGTPDVRAVAMVAWTPEQKIVPPDRDKDGVVDEKDACVDVPGVASADPKKNGCPSDRDEDGVVDAKDACPDVKGVASADAKKHGCPPDRDGDGVVDAVDACPDVKGAASTDAKKHGCPPDGDGDGIVDAADACPREKGVADADPTKNGCPTKVRVTEAEVVILQQVEFDTAKATIRPESGALLDQVAAVLKEHPEIAKVEVQGHTDDRGWKGHNRKLSQDRAESVNKALVARGVDASRLSAKGLGQEQPIADNKTADGRQKNRRVVFKILEKK